MSDIEPGTVAGKSLLINYHEDLWFGFDPERQQFCKETWIDRAKTMEDVRVVVLRLIPDELFPLRGHEKPYIEWQYDIDRPPECGFHIVVSATVHVANSSRYVDPVMRLAITKALATCGTPHYVIKNDCGEVIERGSV